VERCQTSVFWANTTRRMSGKMLVFVWVME
jgi:hypothetical protein